VEYVKDLFLTESFIVKGHVQTGGRRLTNFLNSLRQPFVEVHEATMIGVAQGDRIVTARAMIAVDEILLANELVEAAGDEGQKQLADLDGERAQVNVYLGGRLPIEVSGRMLKRAYVRTDLGDQNFLVVTEPRMEGLPASQGREMALLKRLPYVAINRRRIAYVFDYVQ
jgi:hypothetical protein